MNKNVDLDELTLKMEELINSIEDNEKIKNLLKLKIEKEEKELKQIINLYLLESTSEELQNIIDIVVEATENINSPFSDAVIAGLSQLKHEKEINKPLGELDKDTLRKLNASELADKMTQQLEDIQFDVAEERQEFFKFISGFKSYNYSYRNSMLLLAQADVRGYLPVFASLKEWNKQKTSVKAGEKGLLLCTPQKYNVYYTQNEDGLPQMLPFTFDKKEIEERERLVKEGILTKSQRLTFHYKPTIFSMTQTNMPEEEKVKYLQQYNAHNTSEENLEILNKEIELCERLGINIQIADTKNAALGFLDYTFNAIVVHENMPVDAKISTLTHELGHYFFHRHPEIRNKFTKNNEKNPYALEHADREIQAQLFSHIVLEGLGVDSENEYSLRYINGYLFKDEKNKPMSLSSVKKTSLHAHLSIVHAQAINFVKILSQEEISELEIKQLNDFMPDRYLFDTARQRAEVILNETIQAQEAEVKEKAQEAQQKQNKQQVQKGKMVQSM